jgi:hypothetical protein
MAADQTESTLEETLNVDGSSVTDERTSLSELLGILSPRPKQRILSHLLHKDRPVTFESVVVAVAATDPSSGVYGEASSGPENVRYD